MKRLSLILILILCFALTLGCVEAAEGYNVGDTVGAFHVTDIRNFDAIGADLITLNHDKTGAQVILVLNEDTNRYFQIGFRTFAENQHGTPHVFEHATLCGSEKYPSTDLFFNLSFQTYNTFMNATTYPYMTTYPCASLSEDQLLKYADFYTDSCFNPLIMNEESLFRQESWRYQLVSADAPLTITGTVYNEMNGAYSIDQASVYNAFAAAYPGSYAGNISGGLPSAIPDMTWQELKDYHDKYYHPSNSMTVIYGKITHPEAFLELLDGYFSNYDFKDFTDILIEPDYEPLTSYVEQVFPYAAENGTPVEHNSYAVYTYVCTDASNDDYIVLDMLTTILNSDSSPLITAMREVLPHAKVTTMVDLQGPEVSLLFSAQGINADEAEIFRDTVNDVLSRIKAEGLDRTTIESIAAYYAMDTRLTLESSSLGQTIATDLAYFWAYADNPYTISDINDCLDKIVQWNDDGTYINLLDRYTGETAISALSVTQPVPGLKEEQDAALAEVLAETKAGMSAEEIETVIAQSGNTVIETDSNETAAMVADLTAVTVESLPEEIHIYDIQDVTGEDGVRRIHAAAAADGIGIALMRMNLSGLNEEELLWCQLYINLLCDLDTSDHTAAEITDLLSRYMYNPNVRISVLHEDNANGYTPYFSFNFFALNDDLMKSYELMHEVIFESDFTKTDVIAGRVSAYSNQLKQTINANGYQVELNILMGCYDPAIALYDHVNYTDYYLFLQDISDMLKTDPSAVTDGLNHIRDYLLSTGRSAISAYAGSIEGNELCQAAADVFLAGTDGQTPEACIYKFEEHAESEAMIIETNTSFNVYSASFEDLGIEGEPSAAWVALCQLLNDRYLMPVIRDGLGAYGAYAQFSPKSFSLFTYRDPAVTESFEVFFNLGQMLRNDTEITQEILDGYILSSYSSYALADGELSGAFNALINTLDGESQEDLILDMQQLKSLKVEDLPYYADVLDRLADTGRIATVSSASVISSYADLYAQVNDPFGILTAEPLDIPDLPDNEEDSGIITWCIGNSMMQLYDDGSFGTNDTAVLSDLAVPFYLAVGGDLNPDDAVAFLSQYGILPDDSLDSPLTREQMITYGCAFLEVAAGIQFPDAVPEDYADASDITDGLEALWAWAVESGAVTPDTEGCINPQASASRMDLARLLYVYFAQ